ncbi:MAG: hypothetical protein KA175_09145 [Flavobacteriales bacterium]|nr:hypothetical protein [Flavobacteriales bacterium]MBP6697771.1 hypothetical protein [Flavobacteriales bacterium]
MNRLFTVLLWWSYYPTSPAMACSCTYVPPTFCETMGPNWIGAPELVVLAVKMNDVDHGMDIEVAHVVSGPSQPGDVLRVWGDNGNCCRVYTNTWSVGDTMLLALMPTDLMGNFLGPDLEQVGDWMIFICGQYHLGYSNGLLHGPIAPGLTALPLTGLPALLQGCITNAVPQEVQPLPLRIDRIGDRIIVHLPPGARSAELRVYDAQGRAIMTRCSAAGSLTLNVGDLDPGCYVFWLWGEGISSSQRYVLS